MRRERLQHVYWIGGGSGAGKERMLETFHWFRGEGFGLIVEDLEVLPAEPGVIAEGLRLLPHLVAPLLARPEHAVWLLPIPAFRRAALDSRGTAWDIPNRTSEPARALTNLLERDRMFTDRLAEETAMLGLRVVQVEVGMRADELADRVTRMFRL